MNRKALIDMPYLRERLKQSSKYIFLITALLSACSGEPPNVHQGYVEGEYVYVASPFGGQLDRLLVSRGLPVKQHAALFALESTDEAAARQQAARQLQAAEAQLADMQSGKRPVELDVTRAQLAQAQAADQQTTAQYKRDQAQYQLGAISKEQLEQSRAQQQGNRQQVRSLQSQLASNELPARIDQIRAQAQQVEAARAALAQADWKLNQKAQTSPKAGLVQDTLYREGEWVPAGSPVVKLLPPQNVKVRFFVPQAIVGALRSGQKVSIRCEGCQRDIPATISFISAQAEYTPPVIYSNDTRDKLVFMIEARPSVADAPQLHPGQPVVVTRQ